MLAADTENKTIAPLLTCDACQEQIKGPGTVWTLCPADGQARRAEAFCTHKTCETRFEAMHPPPPGWRWSTAALDRFLELLVQNTVTPRPVGTRKGEA